MLMNRLKKGVDRRLRKEQAGFRQNRGTTEQIFILRNIIEQANEWRSPIYSHFVDFEKAFDSVNRESLWNIMKSYGIPSKMRRANKGIYEGFKCAVMEERETTEWFELRTGVKQGCVMSGFLFLLVIDWVMKRATSEARRGIRWNFMTVLEDLDFADDIALLSSKTQDLKDKTKKVVEESERVDLKLNAKKLKTLRTNNTRNDDNIRIGNEEVEDVDQLVYLGAIIDKEGGGGGIKISNIDCRKQEERSIDYKGYGVEEE